MALFSQYITADEFFEYTGRNLATELSTRGNPTNEVQAFINRVTSRLETYIDVKFHQQVKALYPEFTDYQKEHFKKALIEQCLYVLDNGEIGVDSGYEQEKGDIASKGTIDSKIIGLYAINELILCGLWCTQIGQ